MKVQIDKPDFTPITLTLESQDEVNFIRHLMGGVGGEGRYRAISRTISQLLDKHATGEYEDVFKMKGEIYVQDK